MFLGHSEVSFNHSCLKVPVHSSNRKPAPKYERSSSVRNSEVNNKCDGKKYPLSDLCFSSVKKYLEFYESIPDYSELHHLSNEEFYSRLKSLKVTQKRLCSEPGVWGSFISEEGVSNGKSNFERVGSLRKTAKGEIYKEDIRESCPYAKCCQEKNFCVSGELYDAKNSKISERSRKTSAGIKQPPPKINISDNENGSDFYEPECKKQSDYEADQESSTLQVGETPKNGLQKHRGVEDERLWGNCSKRSRSLPVSPICECESMGYCNNFTNFTFRNENTYKNCSASKGQTVNKNSKKIHTRQIPLASRIPLFDKIMMEKEARRKIIHDLYSEELRSLVKPFSFTKREEKERLRMISSNPELSSLNPPLVHFRAKPVPKNLFSNYAYERMKEEEFYRALKRRVRAEEMLKSSSLPPSMALRERKFRSKSLDFLDYKCPKRSWNKICGYEQSCKNIKREIDFDDGVKNGTSVKRKSKSNWMSNSRKINSATDSSTEISPYETILNPQRRRKERPHSAFNCSRNNLASVLRIETSRYIRRWCYKHKKWYHHHSVQKRKRLEKEIEEKLKENRLKHQARFKAHLARMNPAWTVLRYDKNEDFALRMAARRQEERLKKENHKRLMESIYGRVYNMPPLFHKERFFNGKHCGSQNCTDEKDPVNFSLCGSAEKSEKNLIEESPFVNERNCRSRESSELTANCGRNEVKVYESDDTANEI